MKDITTMTEAQICARLKELSNRRKYRHARKPRVEKREVCHESTMVVQGYKLKGSYKTARQLIDAYEQADWGGLESRKQMFEAGKGVRFTKRTHVNKGAHFTKSGGITTTNRVTADGEIAGSGAKVIVTKRFPNSRLTCVCKSRAY